jgi:thiol-disulfide isomerase/thioredoxin
MAKIRWVVAGAAVAALVYALIPSLPSPAALVDADNGAAAVCPANAKKANLDFTVTDMNGQSVKLSAFKGKVILLDFWATWCPPCKAEIPGLIELHDQYKSKGLVVLGISEDDDAETLRKFAAEWKINYPMLVGLDEDKLFDAYGPLFGIPTSVFVGRDGALCGRHVGPATKEEFEKEITTLL